MARLAIVEDSDDDFPSLADVTRKHGQWGPGRNAPTMGDLTRPARGNTSLSKSRPKSGCNDRSSSGDMQKHKPRKRILNSIHDNPLLRSLDDGKKRTASSPSSRISNLRAANVPRMIEYTEKMNESCKLEGDSGTDEEDPYDEEFIGLSDFLIGDGSHSDDGKSLAWSRRPRRRLVRGRRPSRQGSLSSEAPDQVTDTLESSHVKPVAIEAEAALQADFDDFSNCNRYNTDMERQETSRAVSKRGERTSYSSLDEPLHVSNCSSPRTNLPDEISTSRAGTSPPRLSESQSRLTSPKKLPKTRSTPHRPSMDAFWSQHAVNEWIDEFSPPNALKAVGKQHSKVDILRTGFQPEVWRKSSPVKQARAAVKVKNSFSSKKHEIAEAFLKEIEDEITDGQLSKMAASTGGLKIIWSKRLNTTAGRANWKREAIKRNDSSPDQAITYRHYASIELAEKVIDDENRLLNVLAHEFCHLANFMISGIKTNPHGKEFKSWAAKCSQRFAHRGIEVTTTHSYVIDYKYIWECTNCGIEFKRHSKSIDPGKHQCGSCKSKLVQSKPLPRGSGAMSEYQTFMRENMKRIKEENPASPHKEIMGIVGKRYQEFKASKHSTGAEKRSDVDISGEIEEIMVPGDHFPTSSTIDTVVRRLDFLHLTSP